MEALLVAEGLLPVASKKNKKKKNLLVAEVAVPVVVAGKSVRLIKLEIR